MLVTVVDSVVLYLHGPHEGNVCCFRVADTKVSVWRVDILQGSVLGGGRLQDRRMWSWDVNDQSSSLVVGNFVPCDLHVTWACEMTLKGTGWELQCLLNDCTARNLPYIL
jgi:hypothetical protein